MLKNITIENFREFNLLTIQNLNRINVIVGKNNIGKTTLLEALFIISGGTNPKFPMNFDFWRTGQRRLPETSWFLNLFHYKDTDKKIKFIAEFQNSKIKNVTKITPYYSANLQQETSIQNTISRDKLFGTEDSSARSPKMPRLTEKEDILGITVDYIENNGNPKTYSSSFKIGMDGVSFSIPRNYIEQHMGVMCPVLTLNKEAYTNHYDSLVKSGGKEQLIDNLKIFDNRIIGIENLSDDFYIVLQDGSTLPLSLMGDGLKKYIFLLSAIYTPKVTHLFIDEIENGLHYSTVYTLLVKLIELAQQKNIQLFITSHSGDVIKALSNIGKTENNNMKKEVSLIKLIKNSENEFYTSTYSIDGISEFLEAESEIRD